MNNIFKKFIFKKYILKVMFNRKNKKRKMKKIFQWSDYLNWSKMNSMQKIRFKRAILFPFLAYMVYVFLLKYSMAILIVIGIYYLVRFKDRRKIDK